jgi:hypothetical protein
MSLVVNFARIGRQTLQALLVVASTLVLAACGSTSVTSTGPSPVKCQVTLAGPDSPLAPAAGTTTVTVSTTPECAWTAAADAAWVSRIDPSTGQGSGTLQLAIAANTVATARQTDIVVNGARARIQQGPAPCVIVLANSAATAAESGGTYRVNVSAPTGCAWSASSESPWISITSGSSGDGSGVVELRVDGNPGGTRSGTVTIAGQSFTLTQAAAGTGGGDAPGGTGGGPGCTYGVSPLTQNVPAAGGGGSLSLTTTCAWSVTTSAAWITIQSPTSGTGNASVAFSVATNSGAARQGTITIGNTVVTINQSAATSCSFGVNPTTINAPVGGSTTLSVTVTTTASCSWTASTATSWITITAGASRTGSGTVTFSVPANTGSSRNGTLTVAGTTVTVTQPGVTQPCSFTVSPLTMSVAASAVTGQSVGVTTTNGCTWTAASNISWITVTSGASGNGSGTVKFDVGANSGPARNGTLTVAGQTVTVSQASGCSYTVNPTTVSVGAAGGSGPGITVSSASGCGWSASTATSWLTITSGASGSGNGSVGFTAAQNTGEARSGSLSIAGQTVTVNQAAGCVYAVVLLPTSFRDEGGTAIGTVTTLPGCGWTASSGVSWITVASGASGSGPGTATFTIQQNPGASRSGTVTVAGQTFTITQSNK